MYHLIQHSKILAPQVHSKKPEEAQAQWVTTHYRPVTSLFENIKGLEELMFLRMVNI
jgi:hypothetical protein